MALAWACFCTGLPVYFVALTALLLVVLTLSTGFFLSTCAALFIRTSAALFAFSADCSAARAALKTAPAARFAAFHASIALHLSCCAH